MEEIYKGNDFVMTVEGVSDCTVLFADLILSWIFGFLVAGLFKETPPRKLKIISIGLFFIVAIGFVSFPYLEKLANKLHEKYASGCGYTNPPPDFLTGITIFLLELFVTAFLKPLLYMGLGFVVNSLRLVVNPQIKKERLAPTARAEKFIFYVVSFYLLITIIPDFLPTTNSLVHCFLWEFLRFGLSYTIDCIVGHLMYILPVIFGLLFSLLFKSISKKIYVILFLAWITLGILFFTFELYLTGRDIESRFVGIIEKVLFYAFSLLPGFIFGAGLFKKIKN
ncbi:MAG: hypothetical protein ACK4FM_01155 [Caldimicrobium sp.]